MEPQIWNAMQETLYNNLVMMIQYVTLAIVGSASLLFIIICLAGAVCDYDRNAARFRHGSKTELCVQIGARPHSQRHARSRG